MKYILLGTLSTDWAAKHGQRVESAKKKLAELGITLEAVYYTQGQFDFVDVVEAPDPEALLTFSIWYVTQGFGRIQSMPAFDADTLARAAGKA
ncbi:MAG: GYD domain-containing protein [Kiloniellaceae bacterium]